MDTNLNINENIDTSSLIQGTLRKISSMAALNGQSSVIDQSQKAGFEAAARGFESLFVHTLIKEMKNAMLGDDEENKDLQFGANTLQGYTDLLFADHISKIGKGIGIASMLYKQMTGEELPTITERNPSFNIPIFIYFFINSYISFLSPSFLIPTATINTIISFVFTWYIILYFCPIDLMDL